MSKKAQHLYQFGPFSLDLSEHRLLRDQEVVPLSPKVFETLLLLVEHGGHILERDELMKTLWPDSFVEESSLTQNISLLRKALGENSQQQFIETVPKRGYRFVAPVKVLENGDGDGTPEEAGLQWLAETRVMTEETNGDECDSANEPPANLLATPAKLQRRRVSRNSVLTLAAILLLLTGAGGVYFWKPMTPERQGVANVSGVEQVRSLAVLPFKLVGGESDDKFLGLGMADAIIIKFSSFEQFSVRPTSSIIKYTGREYDAQVVGKELGVDAILDGTVQLVGDRVRVTAMLVNLHDGKPLWSGKFDEKFTDIFALQDSISERVASVFHLQLAAGKPLRINKRFTQDVEAYRYYTMGLYFWNKRTKEELARAIDYFQHAIQIDSNYALAYAMLADTYCLIGYNLHNILPVEEAHKRAKEAATRAIELDSTLTEAHVAMAFLKGVFEADFVAAEQSYQRAIELNPYSAIARFRYGMSLLARLNLDEALQHIKRAQELDPLSPAVNTSLGACLIYTAQYDEAIKCSKSLLEIEPQFGLARFNLGEAYEWKGMYEEAINEYGKLTGQQGFRLHGKLGLASVYARLGHQVKARQLLAEIASQTEGDEALADAPFHIAAVLALLGDKDEAFIWLERVSRAIGVRLYQLIYSRQLDPLKNDPRYKQILLRFE